MRRAFLSVWWALTEEIPGTYAWRRRMRAQIRYQARRTQEIVRTRKEWEANRQRLERIEELEEHGFSVAPVMGAPGYEVSFTDIFGTTTARISLGIHLTKQAAWDRIWQEYEELRRGMVTWEKEESE